MYHQDYIMRIIAQFTEFVAKVIFLKKNGQYGQARSVLQSLYKKYFGLGSEFFHSRSDGAILDFIKVGEDIPLDKCMILAELMLEEAEISELLGEEPEKAWMAYQKAFSLYAEVWLVRKDLFDENTTRKFYQAWNKQGMGVHPPHILWKMFQIYEVEGKYGKCEDVLYELMGYQIPGLGEMAKEFYQKLLQKSDEELIAGGLPRDEVEDGLNMAISLAKKEKK